MLVLDEVQELENWDENVASIFEDASMPCRLIITGSNSNMLSDDFSAKLGGRYTTLQVFPFSFAEFCKFTGSGYATSSVEKYLLAGGMPEVLKRYFKDHDLLESQNIQNALIQTYRDDFRKYSKRVQHQYLLKSIDIIPRLIGQRIKYVNIDQNK